MLKHREWKQCQSKSDQMKVSHYRVISINRAWILTKLGQAEVDFDTITYLSDQAKDPHCKYQIENHFRLSIPRA